MSYFSPQLTWWLLTVLRWLLIDASCMYMCIVSVAACICLSCICWGTDDNVWCLFICASNSAIYQRCCTTSTFLDSSEAGVSFDVLITRVLVPNFVYFSMCKYYLRQLMAILMTAETICQTLRCQRIASVAIMLSFSPLINLKTHMGCQSKHPVHISNGPVLFSRGCTAWCGPDRVTHILLTQLHNSVHLIFRLPGYQFWPT